MDEVDFFEKRKNKGLKERILNEKKIKKGGADYILSAPHYGGVCSRIKNLLNPYVGFAWAVRFWNGFLISS